MKINPMEYDKWKTNIANESFDLEIIITDISEVEPCFILLDEDAIYDAWERGERDFPGLDVRKIDW
jgi:hypothetical protein